jgi:eukaryotic-like serine/threonine-protein kinase
MVPTLEQFVSTVQESGLLGHDLLESTLRDVGGQGHAPDASSVTAALVARGNLTSWQADKLLAGVEKGFFLGKHKLLKLIASGGMSSVYEAEHILMRRRVALKVLPKSLVGETSFLERFYREARAVARLNHPNIVRGFDVGQDGDYHYFVMELIDGSSLEDLVENSGPLPFADAAELIRQAALGLGHAHSAGMVHRDIKPANLLVDHQGTVKILDLGLVRSLPHENENEAGLTRLHDESVLGTVDYLSPEQAIDSHNVDIRSDIYSLGCTLYFLLSGGPPFPTGTLAERLMAHQTRSPTPLVVQRPNLPQALGQIVSTMLAKRPQDRYQSPEEVADVLGDWLVTRVNSPSSPVAKARPSTPRTRPTPEETRRQESSSQGTGNAVDPGEPITTSGASASRSRGPMSPPSPKKSAVTKIRVDPLALPSGTIIPNLFERWDRWARIVEAFSHKRLLQTPISEVTYRVIYDDLLQVCREASEDVGVDDSTRSILRRIEDLASPWVTLRSLKSILRTEMGSSIVERFLELERAIRSRRDPVLSRPSFLKVVVPLVAITILGSIIPFYSTDSTDHKSGPSWLTEAGLALKKLIDTTTQFVTK